MEILKTFIWIIAKHILYWLGEKGFIVATSFNGTNENLLFDQVVNVNVVLVKFFVHFSWAPSGPGIGLQQNKHTTTVVNNHSSTEYTLLLLWSEYA
jgi:hypothetical protein